MSERNVFRLIIKDLRSDIRQHRRDQVETISQLADAMVRYLKAEARVEAGDKERDTLQIDLLQYGDHQNTCALYHHGKHVQLCDCGWAEVEQARHYTAAPGEDEDQLWPEGPAAYQDRIAASRDVDGCHFNPEEQGEY